MMRKVKIHRISAKELNERLDVAPVDEYLARRSLNWFGKVATMEDHRLPKLLLCSWSHGCASKKSKNGFTVGESLIGRCFKKVLDNPSANLQLKAVLKKANLDNGRGVPVKWEGSGRTRTHLDWNWTDLARSHGLWKFVTNSVFNGKFLQRFREGEYEDIGIDEILIKDEFFPLLPGAAVGGLGNPHYGPGVLPDPLVGIHPPPVYPREWVGGTRDEPIWLQFDGGSRGNPGVSGAGFSLMWKIGGEYKECTYGYSFVGHRATNNEAEYSGFVRGLEAARNLGVRHLRIEGDSQLIVNQINRRYAVSAGPLRRFYDDARTLLESLESFTMVHIDRGLNGRADWLANLAMDSKFSKITTLWPAGVDLPLNPLAAAFLPLGHLNPLAVPFVPPPPLYPIFLPPPLNQAEGESESENESEDERNREDDAVESDNERRRREFLEQR